MRKPLVLSLVLSSVPVGTAAVAAPPNTNCSFNDFESGCFLDEVLVVKGDEMVATTIPPAMPGGTPTTTMAPLVSCALKDPAKPAGAGNPKDDCYLGSPAEYLQGGPVERAAQKALELVKAKANWMDNQWDEIVVFTADFGPTNAKAKQHGPLFYRTTDGMGQGVNEVMGIGLPPVGRVPGRPYVGVIAAGNSKTITTPAAGTYAPCADDSPSICFRDVYNYYDSLSQATANIYGPYLPKLSTLPVGKTVLVDPAAMSEAMMARIPGGPNLRVWNSFLNMGGSLLGGNTFRDKGNGTWEVARPTAFQGVSAPFERAQVLRFQPLDLYLMGFVGQGDLDRAPIGSFADAVVSNVYLPAGTAKFSGAVGPGMGVKTGGVALRTTPPPMGADRFPVVLDKAGQLTAGARQPEDQAANQYIRQLWVVVTKPKAEGGDIAKQKTEVQNVARWRRQFNQYFYNMASYRGRVYTAFEGDIDDSGYFEFGDAADDRKDWMAQNVDLAIDGAVEIPNTGGAQMTAARINARNGGALVFVGDGGKHKIRIQGSKDIPQANNVLTVRLRIPAGGADNAFGNAVFTCSNGEKSFRIPSGDASFIPDGRFHNYSVDLTKGDGWTDATCTGFKFVFGADVNDVDLDFIKVANASADNLKDADKNCAGDEEGDGWLALEDNCPTLSNPDQADGNGDGIGDACEDYDGDNVRNACDNCPTVTNSSQRDANKNKQGDACDGSQASDCFFQGGSVAGAGAPTSATLWAGLAAFGLMVAGAIRRRRRR